MQNTEEPKTQKHSPTLNTVLMVEEVLKGTRDAVVTMPELKRRLPRKVNHNTLKAVLEYLEEKGLIKVTLHGIAWQHERKEEEAEKRTEEARKPFSGVA
jgi:DNA-binding transcriptional regulator YhcF (GntR family)